MKIREKKDDFPIKWDCPGYSVKPRKGNTRTHFHFDWYPEKGKGKKWDSINACFGEGRELGPRREEGPRVANGGEEKVRGKSLVRLLVQ